jgi:hypothetical protein
MSSSEAAGSAQFAHLLDTMGGKGLRHDGGPLLA